MSSDANGHRVTRRTGVVLTAPPSARFSKRTVLDEASRRTTSEPALGVSFTAQDALVGRHLVEVHDQHRREFRPGATRKETPADGRGPQDGVNHATQLSTVTRLTTVVELRRFELLTPSMRTRCATNCATAPVQPARERAVDKVSSPTALPQPARRSASPATSRPSPWYRPVRSMVSMLCSSMSSSSMRTTVWSVRPA
jgi:hypothetical protein